LFKRGHRDATTDLGVIEQAFDRESVINIGIVPIADMLIVDVDGPQGEASIKPFNLPPTATVRTGRGRHLYYKCDGLDGWQPPKLPGVTFRFRGNGYVVAPPSRHICGALYEWIDGIDLTASISTSIFENVSVKLDFGKASSRPRIAEGSRNTRLTSIGGLLRRVGHTEEAIERALLGINAVECDPPLGAREVRTIARSVSKYASAAEEAFGDFADVEEEDVEYVLGPYLPRGVPTVLEGDPGVGKSNFTTAIAAAISTGKRLPFAEQIAKGRVLILSAEDDPARVIKPRLIANGADLSPNRVRFAKEPFSLDELGLDRLRQEIEIYRPLLVIIDPLIAWLPGKADSSSAGDMTPFFQQLMRIARTYDCAILVVRHLRKSRHGDALMQGHGSVAIVGSVRSALLMALHPDDKAVRAVAHSKVNYGEFGPTITFSLQATHKRAAPKVDWLGVDPGLSADDLLVTQAEDGPGRPARESEEVRQFLLHHLGGRERTRESVFAQAEARSISKITLERVSREMGIIKDREGKDHYWRLPDALRSKRRAAA
jgi:hypothetical protein